MTIVRASLQFRHILHCTENPIYVFRHILHCTENPIYVFPEMKLRGLVPKSYIHESVSKLYIPRIGLLIWLQQNRQTDPGNM
jgi:hypothetical protein